MAVIEKTVTESVDLDRIEEDATARLGELVDMRQRLSLDALVDSAVRSELESVESELRSCQEALERVALARGERGRRDAAAAEAAETVAREVALGEARRLQVDREACAAVFDEAAEGLAAAATAFLATCDAQDVFLARAGRPVGQGGRRARQLAVDAAFRCAMGSAPPGVLQLDGLPPGVRHMKPLVSGDARPVEAAE
jgi:hypothetical protein